MPLGAPRSLIQMVSKQKGVFIEVGLLPIVITNSFENLFKNLETFLFIIFFYHFFNFVIMKFIPLFRNISKIRNDKRRPKQVYSFHANVDIRAKFTFLEKNTFTNENIHNQKTNKNCS